MTQEELNRQMIKAADNRDTKTVREMLEQGADPNSRDKYGYTALIDACRDGRTDIARLLLEHEADPNVRNNYGETALMYACQDRRTDTARLLVEHGADVNALDRNRETALIWAALGGRTDIMEMLIHAGADPDIREDDGCTAFDILKTRYPGKYDIWIRNTAVKAREDILLQEDSANNSRQVPDFDI